MDQPVLMAAESVGSRWPRPTARDIANALLLILVAINLRPAFSSFGPVLNEAVADTGMSTTLTGIITTIPVLCLGLFALSAPALERLFGTERTLFSVLVTLAGGIALRLLGTVSALFVSAIIIGASIGIASVLLPGLIKRDFPTRMSLMTGIYTMALSIGAATGAGLAAPVAHTFVDGWRAALAIWAVPAALAALVWLPVAWSTARPARAARAKLRSLWRDPVAWQVTLFMGLQSSLAYTMFAWLAPMLRARGLDPVTAGLAISVALVIQIFSSLIAPSLAARRTSQARAVVIVVLLMLAGLLGCLHAPLSTLWFWVVVLGVGQGALFAVSLLLIVLRSTSPERASQLSSMSQSFGYVLGSAGPFLAGFLYDRTGSWNSVSAMFVVIGVAAIIVGIFAGRDVRVGEGG